MKKQLTATLTQLTNNKAYFIWISLGIIHSLLCIMPVDTNNVNLANPIIPPLITAGGALAQGLVNFFGNREQARNQADSAAQTAAENLQFQKENYEYQKQQNDLTRQREDTAVQRRAADLKAAGINPLLAAGSAAQAGSPSLPTAPQRAATNTEKYSMPDFFSALQSFNQTAQTMSQVALTQAQSQAQNQRLEFNENLNPLLLEKNILGNMGQSTSNSRLQMALKSDELRNKIMGNEQKISDQETKEYMSVINQMLREEETEFGRKSTSQASRELDMRYQDWLFLSSKGGPAAFAAKQKALDSMMGLLNNFLPSLNPMGAGGRKVPVRTQNIHNYNY